MPVEKMSHSCLLLIVMPQVTQGGPLSPKIFNIMVDAVVREWISQLLYEDGEEAMELSDATAASLEVGLIVALLYADDAYIASTSRDILQDSMDILTDLFDRVGLRTNTEKTKRTQRRRKS